MCTKTWGSLTVPFGMASAPVFQRKAPWLAARASLGSSRAAMIRPPVAATPFRTPRRLTFSIMYVISRSRRSNADSRLDALVAAATTDVARHGGVDLLGRRVRRLRQQRRRLHDLAGLTVA